MAEQPSFLANWLGTTDADIVGQAGNVGSAAGAIGQAFGSFYSAKMQKNNLEFQAYMANVNARIAELGAQSELSKGQWEVGRLTMAAGKLKSSQRVALAANGVDLGVGNAAEIQASTDILKEMDKNQTTANATRAAWGYRTQAMNFKSQAAIDNTTADSISPMMAGLTTLLGASGTVAQNWYRNPKATDTSGTSKASNSSSSSSSSWSSVQNSIW